ncbi:hypothetical protein Bca52824_014650 [Brassica carinata]|uniref:Uncharacterized protein n=1 Tax=Brassica carinata TaxID=52824 RepID=A0A8X7W1W7_BRACI|nr:hypothetical protein Bca52824_014650 [Brassica carinata]
MSQTHSTMTQGSVNAHWLITFKQDGPMYSVTGFEQAAAGISCFQRYLKLGKLEVGLSEINANNDKLQHFCNELVEYKLLLDKYLLDASPYYYTKKVLTRSTTAEQSEIESQQLGEDTIEALLLQESVDPTEQVKLGFLIGLVPRETEQNHSAHLKTTSMGIVIYPAGLMNLLRHFQDEYKNPEIYII